MRRAQANSGSQPVRNLITNPSFETASGTNVIRTNLATNPSMETASAVATVRTNLALRPRMIDTSLGGYGSQSLTAITGVTGHPDGITTAVRVTHGAGASNPGAIIFNTLVASTQYTFTAWVLNEGPATENVAFAHQGITSGGTQAAVPGVWIRLTWTHTTPVTPTHIGVRMAAPVNAGSFLVTAVTIEQSASVPSTFYDGATAAAGDFTYVWSGSAGTSTSFQQAPGVSTWGTATTSVKIVRSAAQKTLGSYSLLAIGTVDGNRTVQTTMPASAGVIYALSADMRHDSVSNRDLRLDYTFQDSGGTRIGNYNSGTSSIGAGNVWSRKSMVTIAAPAGTATITVYPALIGGVASETYRVDALLVEAVPTVLPYFDGATTAAGDFTYAWVGAANAGTSEQRAPGLGTSIIPVSGRSVIWQTNTSATGSKGLALRRTSSLDSYAQMREIVLKPSTKYTVLFRVRADVATTLQSGLLIQNQNSPSHTQAVMDLPGSNSVTTSWTQHRFVVSTGANFVSPARFIFRPLASPDFTNNVYYDDLMIVEGDYSGDYIDGARPFSKWDGAANTSTSVGYPPQLLDFAGKPDRDHSTTVATVAPQPQGLTGRTTYLVYESAGFTTAYEGSGAYGTFGFGRYTFQTGNSNQNIMGVRFDFPGGDENKVINFSGGRTPGRHVIAVNVNDGLSTITGCLDGASDITTAVNGGTGWSGDSPHNLAITGLTKGIRLLTFHAVHDRTTRLAISRYLGNKYGAYVA